MRDIIERLKSLDLRTCTDEEILGLLSQINKCGVAYTYIHAGSLLFRATILEDHEIPPSHERLSYKPKHLNHSYQRASCPNETMFYATYPDNRESNWMQNGKVAALQEVCPWLRDSLTSLLKNTAVGVWKVIKPLSLFTLTHLSRKSSSLNLQKVQTDLEKFIMKEHANESDNLIAFQNFISDEFNKKVSSGNEYEYRISALFTQLILSKNKSLNGVCWQSPISKDEKLSNTLNIAISPEAADTNLQLFDIKIQVPWGKGYC